ncbi:DUF86 domain-containing protein [bacterium]|nr:DUF86 domain-containing protein [bacterium]MBU1754366.1 DUF86 domain-containing protein [bacterium]
MSKKKEDRDIRDYLNDILEMIEDIKNFTEGISYEGLERDKKTLYAAIRCLEVLGEAVKKIPNSIREEYPEIPWQEIAGMRDRLIHEYFGVDMETIWDTIQEDLSPLKETITKIIMDVSF